MIDVESEHSAMSAAIAAALAGARTMTATSSQGPFAMPDYYFELRRQQTAAIEDALAVLDELAADFIDLTGRVIGAIDEYRLDGAERALICLGSTAGTAKDVVDELRGQGEPVGLLKIRSFRPFPATAVRVALERCRRVAVLDRADSPGGVPPLAAEVIATLAGKPAQVISHVYGLGGRDLHPADLHDVFRGTAPQYVGLRSEPCPA